MKNNQKTLTVLNKIGLSEFESETYLAVLDLGETTVLQISRVTNIKRTTLYHVLESLKNKGLISINIKGLKSYIVPENPENISELLEKNTILFSGILPELKTKYITKNKNSSIKEYIGLEAIKTVYNNILKDIQPKDNYYIMSHQSDWFNTDPLFFEDFMNRRAKLPITIKMLSLNTEEARYAKKFEKNFNLQVKILPKENNFSTNLVITPQKIVIHRLVQPMTALVITDPVIIQMHKEMFEIMWNTPETQ